MKKRREQKKKEQTKKKKKNTNHRQQKIQRRKKTSDDPLAVLFLDERTRYRFFLQGTRCCCFCFWSSRLCRDRESSFFFVVFAFFFFFAFFVFVVVVNLATSTSDGKLLPRPRGDQGRSLFGLFFWLAASRNTCSRYRQEQIKEKRERNEFGKKKKKKKKKDASKKWKHLSFFLLFFPKPRPFSTALFLDRALSLLGKTSTLFNATKGVSVFVDIA